MSAEAAQGPRGAASAAVNTRSPLTLSFSASLAIQAMNVLTGLLLARTLGPHGRGELAAVVLWPSVLVTVGSLGITDAVTFHAARATEPLGTLAGSCLAVVAAQSVVCVVAGVAIFPWVFHRYDAETVRAAYLFLAFVPLNLFVLTIMSVLNGLHKFGQYQTLRLVLMVSTNGGIVALRLFDNLTVLHATTVYLGAAVGTCGLAVIMLVAVRPGRIGFSMPLARRMLAFGFKSHSGIVTSMMNERLDQVLISVFLSPVQLGLYVMAVTLTSPASLVGTSIASAAFPIVARLEPGEARRKTVGTLVRMTLAGSAAIAIPLIIVAPWLIDFFFKSTYHDATNVSRVLLVGAVALSTNRALAACAKALDRPLDSGIAELLGLVVTIAGLAVFLPTLGIMGAAIVSLLAYALSTAWMLRRLASVLEMPVAALLLPDRVRLRRTAHGPAWARPLEVVE